MKNKINIKSLQDLINSCRRYGANFDLQMIISLSSCYQSCNDSCEGNSLYKNL